MRLPEADRNRPLAETPKPLPVNDLAASGAGATLGPYSFDLDDLDLCDDFTAFGWLVALPELASGPLCPVHGHGHWWEGRHDGRIHCVACWPQPPVRSMVVRVWESAPGDAPILAGCGFASDQFVFVTPIDGAAPWPWQDNQPAEPAFV